MEDHLSAAQTRVCWIPVTSTGMRVERCCLPASKAWIPRTKKHRRERRCFLSFN